MSGGRPCGSAAARPAARSARLSPTSVPGRRRAGIGCAIAACGALAAALASGQASRAAEAGVAPPAPDPAVALVAGKGFELRKVRFSGGLVGSAVLAPVEGRSSVVFLARPSRAEAEEKAEPRKESAPPTPAPPGSATEPPPPLPCAADESAVPLTLWLLRDPLSAGGTLERLRDDLPGDATAVRALDADGDGLDEILLVRPGRIDLLRSASGRLAASGPEPLVEDPALGWGLLANRADATAAERRLLHAPTLGGVRSYAPGPDGAYRLLAESLFPVVARRDGAGFRVESPAARPVGAGPSGRPLLASAPIAADAMRLHSVLFDPTAPTAEERQVEAWARLPQQERVIETAFLRLDGRPALAVTSRRADKLSFFGEKFLRLYPLERDRSRAGLDPLFAAESRMNLWQSARLVVLDADGDGRDDLVAAYWKGLKDDTVVIDAYLRREDGSFDPDPRSTAFDVKDGERNILGFGEDLDGDGRSELVLGAAGRLLVFRGQAGKRGAGLVERPARWSLPAEGILTADLRDGEMGDVDLGLEDQGQRILSVTPAPGSRRAADLDGDGRNDLFWTLPTGKGTSTFVLVSLR